MTKLLVESTPETRFAGLERDVDILKRRPPGDVTWEIKVHSDEAVNPIVAGDGKFIHLVSRDMDGLDLVDAEAYVTTVASGTILIQIRNVMTGLDILSTRLQIDSGEKNSKDAATAAVINRTNSQVSWGNHIAIDLDSAGTGSKGLGLVLTFRQVR